MIRWSEAGRPATRARSLDLGFLEFNVLAHDGIIFAHRHLFGLVARILLGYVEEASVSGADETDFDGGRLCHDLVSLNAKPTPVPKCRM